VSARLLELKDSYLSLRRSLGYRLDEAEYHIRAFISWLDENRDGQSGFSVEDAIEWACLHGGRLIGHTKRLRSIRGWAAYAHVHDPAVPMIPARALPADDARPTPYIYREGEVRKVMDVFARYAKTGPTWRSQWLGSTFCALTGFLACTGARVGEAIALDRGDVDIDTGWVKITGGKTGRERLVLLHPTALQELNAHFDDPARPSVNQPEPAFMASFGQRVEYTVYQKNFHAAVTKIGLEPQGQATPTIHGLRHSFAVGQLAAAYRDGADPARRLTLLSTWLGHVSPKNTYWYLTATPELLGAAADLVEQEMKP
jgi:integrase